jgi:hypothetical protein
MKKNQRFLFVSALALVSITCVFLIQVQVSKGEGEDITCGPNSYLSGDQCLCDAGYGAASGSNDCVPNSEVCAAYGPSHRVGNDCVCNDGYKILNGGNYCESMSSACAQFDAIWSAASNDCVCKTGFHEDDTVNKCVADTPVTTPKTDATKPTDTSPTVTTPTTNNKSNTPVPITTPPTVAPAPLDPINTLMSSDYSKLTPQVQAVISDNQAPANQIVQAPFTPASDLYSGDTSTPSAQESVTKSLTLVTPSEQQSAQEQLSVLSDFSDTPDSEVSISTGGMGVKLQEAFVEQKYTNELQTWNNQVQEAEKQSKLKENIDPQQYSNATEMESRLKAQIAALEKIVGYNHLRCLEATRVMKFENMPTDYRAYYKGQSAENTFNSASEGVAFDGAARNVTATTEQIRELKSKLSSDYPPNWKTKYLAVPDQPVRDKVVAPQNIFNVFEGLKNK